MSTRRAFVATLLSAFPALSCSVAYARLDHPEPRPGVDASQVVPALDLTHYPDAAPVLDMVREIPQIIDGIRCQCGCSDMPDKYSLLSCFEGKAMGQRCAACKAQVRAIHRLHREGKTLAEIRAAIDEEFGS